MGRNLEAAGFLRRPGEQAHHIVAQNNAIAKATLGILKGFGIDVHDAENGVWLPKDEATAAALGSKATPHNGLHKGKYYEAINEALAQASNREEAIEILRSIRQQLLDGEYPK